MVVSFGIDKLHRHGREQATVKECRKLSVEGYKLVLSLGEMVFKFLVFSAA